MENELKINFVKLIQELSANFNTVSFFEIEDLQCGELIYNPVMKIRAHTPVYKVIPGETISYEILKVIAAIKRQYMPVRLSWKEKFEELIVRVDFQNKIAYELIGKDEALKDLRILQTDLNEIIRKKYHDDHNLSPSARKLVELSKI